MQYSRFVAVVIAAVALPAAEFSAYIGDEHTWNLSKIVVDASGNTYVAGSRTFNLSYDALHPDPRTEAVVVKLDANGKRVLLANIGGKGTDIAYAVAVDRAGNIYVGGSTNSPNFPLRNALYPDLTPTVPGIFGTLGFITKLTPDAAQIVYSTYFPSIVRSIVVDSEGAAYVGGTTYSSTFPTTPGLPKGPSGSGVPIISAAFLTKIDASGAKIVWSTVISGTSKPCGAGSSCFTSSRGATGVAVAVDGAGNAYLTGNSDVIDLPTTPGGLTPSGAGAFVAKVNAAGTGLVYLTYIGAGSRTIQPFFDVANRVSALAVDAAGNAFVAGSTWDDKLPFSNGLQGSGGQPPTDAFAMKLNPTGTAIVWGRYLGGSGVDQATAATLDSSGNFWVAGETRSTEFPNADGWSLEEDFIVKFDSRGELPYTARYPTGTVRQSIGIDPAGLIHVAIPAGVMHAIAASPRPAVRPWTIGPNGGQIAPGLVLEMFGPHIGGPGAQVFFNDLPAPILYADDRQINTIVPYEVEGQKTVRVRIGSGPEFVTAVLPAMPRIFALVNQDGTVNGPENPAQVGAIMTAWVSGSGYREHLGFLYTEDGRPVTKVYEGGYQINFVAPAGNALLLTSGKYASPPFDIYVRPATIP